MKKMRTISSMFGLPDSITVRINYSVPGISGIVVEGKCSLYVHVKHTKHEKYHPISYGYMKTLPNEAPLSLIDKTISLIPSIFDELIKSGEFVEPKYYKRTGKMIPGTDKVKKFNSYVLLDRKGHMFRTGSV